MNQGARSGTVRVLLALAVAILILTTLAPGALATANLSSTTLIPRDSDGDGLNDVVNVTQRVSSNLAGSRLYSITAKLYGPGVNLTSGVASDTVTVSKTADCSVTCGGGQPELVFTFELRAPVSQIHGVYNITFALTATPGNTDQKVVTQELYPLGSYAFAVAVDTTFRAAIPGARAAYLVTVTSLGNNPDTATVAATSLAFSVTLDRAAVPLAPGASGKVNVSVGIPVTAGLGYNDTETVTVQSTRDPSKRYTVTLHSVVVMADLAIAPADVVLSNPRPNRDEVVTITVTVSNLGNAEAPGVVVQFAVGGQVASTANVGSIPGGGRKTLVFNWTVGDARDLTFTVDPQDTVRESNEGNNEARVQVAGSGPDALVIGAAAGGVGILLLLFLFFFLLPRWRRSSGTPPPQGLGIIGGFLTKPRGSPPPPRAKAPSLELVPGHTYLVEEEKRAQSLKIFEDMLKKGRKGLLITRMNPKAVEADGALQGVRSYWLADVRGHGSLDALVLTASLESIIFTVEEFLQENPDALILLDGVEFLVDNNNFNAVLRFLRRLVDLTSQGDRLMLVSVSPGTLQERELKNLEREMDVLRLA